MIRSPGDAKEGIGPPETVSARRLRKSPVTETGEIPKQPETKEQQKQREQREAE